MGVDTLKEGKLKISIKELLESGAHFGHQKRRWKIQSELEKYDSFEGVISSIETNKGSTFIKLGNKEAYWLKFSRNLNYSDPWLSRFLQTGDKIQKLENSDSLIIIRADSKYYFRLGKTIDAR